jgi:molybdate transport system substrate-binding protein
VRVVVFARGSAHCPEEAVPKRSRRNALYCSDIGGAVRSPGLQVRGMRNGLFGSLALVALALMTPAAADEITVAVATNFSAAMNDLAERFEQRAGHTVRVSAASTGNHYAQIKNGAPFDVFFSADAERPRLLEQEGAAIAGSRFRYAVGRVVLWSPVPGYVDEQGRVLETGEFRRLAIANPDLAPYGAAARETLLARGLWERLWPRLAFGQDIGQAYAFVQTRNAELGFVALAQLKQSGKEIEGSYWLVPESFHRPIEQEAVLLRDVPAARAFLEFVQSDEGREVIRLYGYGP